MKSTQDNKTTLIHYIVKELEQNGTDVDLLKQELQYLNEASLHSTEGLSQEFECLKKKLMRLKEISAMFGEEDDFQRKINSFLQLAEKETSDVESDVSIASKLNENLAKYFCENLKDFKMEECFKNLNIFCEACCRAKQENVERKRLAEEAERRRKERMQTGSGKEFNTLERRRAQDNNNNVGQYDDSTDSIPLLNFEASKSLRRSVKRSWIRCRQVENVGTEDSSEEKMKHESLVDFLEGSNELTIKRTRSFRSSSLNASFGESERPKTCRAAIQNIDVDTRERVPACESPVPRKSASARLSTPRPSSPSDENKGDDDARYNEDFSLKDLTKQISDYVNSNNDINDEGFESDRFSGSQRSSVCSTTENESPASASTQKCSRETGFNKMSDDESKTTQLLMESRVLDDAKDVPCEKLPVDSPLELIDGVANDSPCHVNHHELKPEFPSITPPNVTQITNDKVEVQSKGNATAEIKNPKFKKTRLQRHSSIPTATAASQAIRSIHRDNSNLRSPSTKMPQTPLGTSRANESQRSRASSKDSRTSSLSILSPNRRTAQRSLNEKIKDHKTDEVPGLLVRGSSRRKTIEPSALNKNKKMAQATTAIRPSKQWTNPVPSAPNSESTTGSAKPTSGALRSTGPAVESAARTVKREPTVRSNKTSLQRKAISARN